MCILLDKSYQLLPSFKKKGITKHKYKGGIKIKKNLEIQHLDDALGCIRNKLGKLDQRVKLYLGKLGWNFQNSSICCHHICTFKGNYFASLIN